MLVIISEETARLLTDLADIETKKGTAITACTALSKEREQVSLLLYQRRSFGRIVCFTLTKIVEDYCAVFSLELFPSQRTPFVYSSISNAPRFLKHVQQYFTARQSQPNPGAEKQCISKLLINFLHHFVGFSILGHQSKAKLV